MFFIPNIVYSSAEKSIYHPATYLKSVKPDYAVAHEVVSGLHHAYLGIQA